LSGLTGIWWRKRENQIVSGNFGSATPDLECPPLLGIKPFQQRKRREKQIVATR